MAPERRNQIVLGVLVVVLLGALYQAVMPTTEPGGPAAAPVTQTVRGRGGADAAPTGVAAPDVRLETLDHERVKPASGDRNPFRFLTRPAAASPAPNRVPAPPREATDRSAPTVPTVPPITLKFIGVVQATEQSQTYAVLRDDRGVYHGREGDIIEGRYRILRIGAESIELSYVDGQGRQTIRLGS